MMHICRLLLWPASLNRTPLDIWPRGRLWNEFLHPLAVEKVGEFLASPPAAKHLRVRTPRRPS